MIGPLTGHSIEPKYLHFVRVSAIRQASAKGISGYPPPGQIKPLRNMGFAERLRISRVTPSITDESSAI